MAGGRGPRGFTSCTQVKLDDGSLIEQPAAGEQLLFLSLARPGRSRTKIDSVPANRNHFFPAAVRMSRPSLAPIHVSALQPINQPFTPSRRGIFSPHKGPGGGATAGYGNGFHGRPQPSPQFGSSRYYPGAASPMAMRRHMNFGAGQQRSALRPVRSIDLNMILTTQSSATSVAAGGSARGSLVGSSDRYDRNDIMYASLASQQRHLEACVENASRKSRRRTSRETDHKSLRIATPVPAGSTAEPGADSSSAGPNAQSQCMRRFSTSKWSRGDLSFETWSRSLDRQLWRRMQDKSPT